MSERPGAIKFKGNEMTLVGGELKAGDAAPDFSLIANDLSEKTLADYAGKTLVLVTVPSLDTGVCDIEAKRFNSEAAGLGDGVVVAVVSVDLPFAQKRWCGASDAGNIVALSDYKTHAFGAAYGLRIKELGLLTRAIVVVDGSGKVSYVQVVPEVTTEPDYDAVIAAVKAAG